MYNDFLSLLFLFLQGIVNAVEFMMCSVAGRSSRRLQLPAPLASQSWDSSVACLVSRKREERISGR